MADRKQLVSKPPFEVEGLVETYANNVSFHPTSWDLGLLFGNLAKRETDTEVELWVAQHTKVRLTWQQAKVMAILLFVNITAYEEDSGTIKIPPNIIPVIVPDEEVGLSAKAVFSKLACEKEKSGECGQRASRAN